MTRGAPWGRHLSASEQEGSLPMVLSRMIRPRRKRARQALVWHEYRCDELQELEALCVPADRQKDRFSRCSTHELRNPVAPITSAAEARNGSSPISSNEVSSRWSASSAYPGKTPGWPSGRCRALPWSHQLHCEDVSLDSAYACDGDDAAAHSGKTSPAVSPSKSAASRERRSRSAPAQCIANLLSNACVPPRRGRWSRHFRSPNRTAMPSSKWQTPAREILRPEFPAACLRCLCAERAGLDRSQGGLSSDCRCANNWLRWSETGERKKRGPAARLIRPADCHWRAERVQADRGGWRGDCAVFGRGRQWRRGWCPRNAIDTGAIEDPYGVLLRVRLAELPAFAPHVALLDIRFAGYDGLRGLASRMRSAAGASLRLMPIHSGYGQPEDRARSKSVGFDAHLDKRSHRRAHAAAGNEGRVTAAARKLDDCMRAHQGGARSTDILPQARLARGVFRESDLQIEIFRDEAARQSNRCRWCAGVHACGGRKVVTQHDRGSAVSSRRRESRHQALRYRAGLR